MQIHFEYSKALNWTDKTMLSFTRTLGSLIDSPEVTQAVLEDLHQQGFALTEKEFQSATYKEQRFYGWKLVANTNNTQLTGALLNTWQTAVIAAIDSDLARSQEAYFDREIAQSWLPCLQQLPSEPMHPICNSQNSAVIAANYGLAISNFETASSKIHFLGEFPPAYTVQRLDAAQQQKNSLVDSTTAILIGAFAGILIGVLTIQAPWTEYIHFKRD